MGIICTKNLKLLSVKIFCIFIWKIHYIFASVSSSKEIILALNQKIESQSQTISVLVVATIMFFLNRIFSSIFSNTVVQTTSEQIKWKSFSCLTELTRYCECLFILFGINDLFQSIQNIWQYSRVGKTLGLARLPLPPPPPLHNADFGYKLIKISESLTI